MYLLQKCAKYEEENKDSCYEGRHYCVCYRNVPSKRSKDSCYEGRHYCIYYRNVLSMRRRTRLRVMRARWTTIVSSAVMMRTSVMLMHQVGKVYY